METTSQKLLNSINATNNVVQHALDNDKEVIQCAYVRAGYFKSNYKDWVQNSKPCVRKLIAETYSEYVPLLPCETDWELIEVGNYLLEQTKPKLDVLEKFLTKIELLNHNLKITALQLKHEMLTHKMITRDMTTIEKATALQLKHETLTRDMTSIEKTMSLLQLWQSNSPFWTEKLTGNEIVDVIYAYSWSDKSRDEFDFEEAYNNARHPLHRRLTSSRPYLNINEILNEEPKCNKILTPLIC